MRHLKISIVLGLLYLFCVPAHAQRVRSNKQTSYQSIFKDFYDLATPHNRGNDFAFGLGAQFATVIPFSRMGSTDGVTAGVVSSNYSTYFNFQGRMFLRMLYYAEAYFVFGYNEINSDIPLGTISFQHASIVALPVMLGFKYRMRKGDFVPYLFAAGGIYFVKFKASEEGSELSFSSSKKAIGYNGGFGMEIFVSTHWGFCFEMGYEQIHHGTLTLGDGSQFNDGPYTFKAKTGGVLLTSTFFYEF